MPLTLCYRLWTHRSSLIRYIFVVLLSSVLCGCIPTVTRVYETPMIYGYVLDGETLKPMSGVTVAHQTPKATPVFTDEQGFFELPSISGVQGTILMAAHAMTDYNYTLGISGRKFQQSVRGSMKMLSEEVTYASILVTDGIPQSALGDFPHSDQFLRMIHLTLDPAIEAKCDARGLKRDILRIASFEKLGTLGRSLTDTERHNRVTVYQSAYDLWGECYEQLDEEDVSSWGLENVQAYRHLLKKGLN